VSQQKSLLKLLLFLSIVAPLLLPVQEVVTKDICKVVGEKKGIKVEVDHLLLTGVVKAVRVVEPKEVLKLLGVKEVLLLTIDVMDESCKGQSSFFLHPENEQVPAIGHFLAFEINKNECREGETPIIISIFSSGEGK